MPEYVYYSPIDNKTVDLLVAVHNTHILNEDYDEVLAVEFASSEAGLDFFYPDHHSQLTEHELREAIELHASQWRKPA